MNYNSDEGLLLYSSTVVLLISFKLEVWLPVSSLLISSWMELRDKHHDMSCYTFIRRWQQKPTALTGNDKPQWTQSIHKSNHCTKVWRDEDNYLFHSGLKKKNVWVSVPVMSLETDSLTICQSICPSESLSVSLSLCGQQYVLSFVRHGWENQLLHLCHSVISHVRHVDVLSLTALYHRRPASLLTRRYNIFKYI